LRDGGQPTRARSSPRESGRSDFSAGWMRGAHGTTTLPLVRVLDANFRPALWRWPKAGGQPPRGCLLCGSECTWLSVRPQRLSGKRKPSPRPEGWSWPASQSSLKGGSPGLPAGTPTTRRWRASAHLPERGRRPTYLGEPPYPCRSSFSSSGHFTATWQPKHFNLQAAYSL